MVDVEPASGLSPDVLRQVRRLGGRLPSGFTPRGLTHGTTTGDYPVPAAIQMFLALRWGTNTLCTNDDSRHPVRFGRGEDIDCGTTPAGCAWCVIGMQGDGQYRWMVNLAMDVTADPLVSLVDGDGLASDAPRPLSVRLAELKATERNTTGRREAMGVKTVRLAARNTRLPRACAVGDLVVVTRELADSPDGLGPLDASGITPLHLAVLSGSAQVTQALLKAGADPNAVIKRRISTPWKYLDRERHAAGDFRIGETPLHASVSGNVPRLKWNPSISPGVVRALLDGHADVNMVDEAGRTPIHYAVDRYSSSCADDGVAAVRLLLAAGACVDTVDESGCTPLHDAIRGGNLEAVRLLLASGADPESAANGQDIPLAKAMYRGRQMVELLLDAGADPQRATGQVLYGVPGVTAVHCALLVGRATLKVVLARTTNPNLRTPGGITPLHLAIRVLPDTDDRVQMLVAAGADVNARLDNPAALRRDLRSHTPLGIARELGKIEIADFLQQAGAVAENSVVPGAGESVR